MKSTRAAALALLGATFPAAGEADPAAIPQILAAAVDGGVRLEASVLGVSDGDVTAIFTIERDENGNRMRSSQSTTLPLLVGERMVVAQTTLSLDPSADMVANLVLQSNGVVIGDARLNLSGQED